MNIIFEELQEKDLKECYNLCMKCFNESTDLNEVMETYKLCVNNPDYHFIVGKVNNKIAAYATMSVFYNLFDGKYPVAALWYVCVDKEYRRMGIGKRLFDEIEKIAAKHNCEIIYLTCLKDNYPAHEFYRSIGYSDDKEKAFVKYF